MSITLTASGTGGSVLNLPTVAEYSVQAASGGAYSLDIQRNDGLGNWSDVYYDATTKVTLASTGVQSVRLPAGQYRANVTTYNSAITLTAVQCA